MANMKEITVNTPLGILSACVGGDTESYPEIEETVSVLVVEPGRMPYSKEIVRGLKSLQEEVGECIQTVYPFEEPVALICDDEAKIKKKPLNRALRDGDGDIYDIVAGTFLLLRISEGGFSSLTKDQIEKYSNLFRRPETFLNVNGKIIVYYL